MIKAKLYNQAGEEKGEVKLNPEIFGMTVSDELVRQALVAVMANKRQVIAHSKDRSEVRGGGRKPWKQKGTGRARHGSTRSPIWKGGGVTFGPRNVRNFSKDINKKMKVKAVLMILSDKANNQAIKILEKLEMTEPKTKKFADLTKNIKMEKSGLIVLDKMDKKIALSVSNIPKVEVIAADSLNIYDLLKYNHTIITKQALAKLEEVFLKK